MTTLRQGRGNAFFSAPGQTPHMPVTPALIKQIRCLEVISNSVSACSRRHELQEDINLHEIARHQLVNININLTNATKCGKICERRKILSTDLKPPVVCVFYRSLQEHVRVQLDLQLNAGFSPHLQVTEMTHQLLTHRITATTKLHRNIIPVTQKPPCFNQYFRKDALKSASD